LSIGLPARTRMQLKSTRQHLWLLFRYWKLHPQWPDHLFIFSLQVESPGISGAFYCLRIAISRSTQGPGA
jgi:hypothetical protein